MQFIAKGVVTLEGVTFYITADDLADAQRRALNADYVDVEYNGAGIVDCAIIVRSVEPNE